MSDIHYIRPACSNKVRPSVHKGSKGNQWWTREVYHAMKSGITTYCGIDASNFLRMDQMPIAHARADDNFCKRCAVQCAAIT